MTSVRSYPVRLENRILPHQADSIIPPCLYRGQNGQEHVRVGFESGSYINAHKKTEDKFSPVNNIKDLVQLSPLFG